MKEKNEVKATGFNKRTELYNAAVEKSYAAWIKSIEDTLNNAEGQVTFNKRPLIGVLIKLIEDGFDVSVMKSEKGKYEVIVDCENNKEHGLGRLSILGDKEFAAKCAEFGLINSYTPVEKETDSTPND